MTDKNMNDERALDNLAALRKHSMSTGKTVRVGLAFEDDTGDIYFFSDDGRGNGDCLFIIKEFRLKQAIMDYLICEEKE